VVQVHPLLDHHHQLLVLERVGVLVPSIFQNPISTLQPGPSGPSHWLGGGGGSGMTPSQDLQQQVVDLVDLMQVVSRLVYMEIPIRQQCNTSS
jgi:hypothetical protein